MGYDRRGSTYISGVSRGSVEELPITIRNRILSSSASVYLVQYLVRVLLNHSEVAVRSDSTCIIRIIGNEEVLSGAGLFFSVFRFRRYSLEMQ